MQLYLINEEVAQLIRGATDLALKATGRSGLQGAVMVENALSNPVSPAQLRKAANGLEKSGREKTEEKTEEKEAKE